MGFTWRQLVGSTDRFAVEMSLVMDPDEGRHATPDLSESWGELKIFVDGMNLCEAQDPTGIMLEGARWYLLPVLRFLVNRWEPLMHQGRLPFAHRFGTSAASEMASSELPPTSLSSDIVADRTDAWWSFFSDHCLASARDGGIFPNVWFRRVMDDIEISWDNESNPAETPIRFMNRAGAALVPIADFAEIVGGIVSATLTELTRRITSAELIELTRELDSIKSPNSERRLLRHALLLNLRRIATESVEFARRLATRGPLAAPYGGSGAFAPASLPALVFASVRPNITEKDALLILSEFEKSAGLAVEGPLMHLREEVPCPFNRPWKSGHELALQLRSKLSLGTDRIEIDEVMQGLGVSVRNINLSDTAIRAVSFVDEGIAPTVLVNIESPRNKRDWSKRATLAHELCHLAFDRALGKPLGIASGPWAPVRFEQRANAFAVMFLMPEAGVSKIFESATGPLGGRVVAVAEHFGTGFRATVEHLFSLALIERDERDFLLAVLEEAEAQRA